MKCQSVAAMKSLRVSTRHHSHYAFDLTAMSPSPKSITVMPSYGRTHNNKDNTVATNLCRCSWMVWLRWHVHGGHWQLYMGAFCRSCIDPIRAPDTQS
eukprot:scaffold559964_cov42-Prasinocladus_malaysianus.AAC.1